LLDAGRLAAARGCAHRGQDRHFVEHHGRVLDERSVGEVAVYLQHAN
jgi:hypothetical protein